MPPALTLLPNEDGMDDPGIHPSPDLWEGHGGPHGRMPPPGRGGRGPFIVLALMVAVAVVFLVQIFLR